MESLEAIAQNLNTWLVLLFTGAFVWAVQQVAPAQWVEAPWWKKIMKVIPLLVGALIALIPHLQPVPDNLVHCAAVGFILGTMAQSAYRLLREFGPQKMKAFLGARSKRVNNGD